MQPALFATVYALQALRQKFDVTNTTPVQLHVDRTGLVAQRDGAAAMDINFVAGIDRRLNCAEVYVRRIDTRLHSADEVTSQGKIAGRVPGFDQRLQLPIGRGVSVVAQSVRQGNCGLAFLPSGTETQINAEDRAFGCCAGEQVRQKMRQANGVLTQRDISQSNFRAGEEIEQIDV